MSAETENDGYALARVGASYVVRRLAARATHLVDWPRPPVAGHFVRPYEGIPSPAVALCGAVLRDAVRPLVIMREGTEVHCRACSRIGSRTP